MTFLGATLLAPFVGAGAYPWLHRHPGSARVVDKALLIAVPLFILWHLVGHGFEEVGWAAIAAASAGTATPWAVERLLRPLARHADSLSLVAGLSGLVIHALGEGAALVAGTASFGAAVALHRVPVGLFLWWVARPRYGALRAVAALGVLSGATLAGFLLGNSLVERLGAGIHLYEAFVAGSLLHVVLHQTRRDHRHD